jgi:hypothetical protein
MSNFYNPNFDPAFRRQSAPLFNPLPPVAQSNPYGGLLDPNANLPLPVNQGNMGGGAGCYIVTKEACEILCKNVFPIDTHVDAYFFLLNHFGYIKMIMSDKDIIFHGGDFDTNISHGVLKCSDNNSINTNSNKLKNSSTTLVKDNTELPENTQFNFILCVLLLLIIIIIIISIKLYIIYNMKNI